MLEAISTPKEGVNIALLTAEKSIKVLVNSEWHISINSKLIISKSQHFEFIPFAGISQQSSKGAVL